MNELFIQNYLRKNGLQSAINKFSLLTDETEDRILLKYSQIDSDFSYKEARECRGLILNKNNWDVVSMAFLKFFNYFEYDKADNIDWDSAMILKKIDGSIISLYYDKGKWNIATSGKLYGDGNMYNSLMIDSDIINLTFSELAFKILKEKYNYFYTKLINDKLERRRTYIFELTSPFNIIVTPHKERKMTLLSIRDLDTLNEFSRKECCNFADENRLDIVREYDYPKDLNKLIDIVKEFKYYDEGFVVVDKYFNRIKIKSPAYLSVHHLKGNKRHNVIDAIRMNEIAELVEIIPERKEEIIKIKRKYDLFVNTLTDIVIVATHYVNGIDIWNKEEDKAYATMVFKLLKENKMPNFINGYLFNLKKNDYNILTVEEYIKSIDKKKLFMELVKS